MIREAVTGSFPLDDDLPAEQTAGRSEPYPFASFCSPHPEQQRMASRDLKRRILNFLASRSCNRFRQLEVEVIGGVVMLRGRVRSYQDKQLASDCCSRVAGVLRVVDGIYVVAQPLELNAG